MRELAVATDTRLNEVYYLLTVRGIELNAILEDLRRWADQKYDYRTRQWSGTWDEVLAKRSTPNPSPQWHKYDSLREDRFYLSRERDELIEIYEQHRWPRFYLVVGNGKGHIHSSRNCHSCYPDTQYLWVTALSGATEAEAVAEEGEILCTFCFPTAPTEWTEGIGRRTREAQEARAAEKAARAAQKALKSLSMDGSVVTITSDGSAGYGRYKDLKTYRAAELWLVDAMVLQRVKAEGFRGRTVEGYSEDNIALVASLMAQKKATTPTEILAAVEKRVAKRTADELAAERKWAEWRSSRPAQP